MRILFIGGAGFLGSNLIARFARGNNHSIFVIEPKGTDLSRLEGLNVNMLSHSLSETDSIRGVIRENGIEVVVHLASTLIPGSNYDDYVREFKTIIFPSIELMEYCANEQIKCVFFSSGGATYGNRNDMQPFHESDELRPISYYGWSKQMLENSILFKHRTQNLRYLILRPSNPYGHGQNLYGKQGIVAVAIGKILKGEPVEVWGDGSAIRDYIYINDLAEIVYQLIEKNVSNETINVGCGRGYSVNDVLAFLKIITKQDFKIDYQNVRPMDVSNVVLDTTRLRQLVDVKLTPMLDGISAFYKETLSNKNKGL